MPSPERLEEGIWSLLGGRLPVVMVMWAIMRAIQHTARATFQSLLATCAESIVRTQLVLLGGLRQLFDAMNIELCGETDRRTWPNMRHPHQVAGIRR